MDGRALIAASIGELERLLRDDRSARMAAIAGLAALLATMVLTLGLGRLRRRQVGRRVTAESSFAADPGSFGDWGGSHRAGITWPIDRVLPRRLAGTVGMALAVAIGIWLLGLAMAPSIPAFLASREWHFQPFYFAAHLVALRLFILVYGRGFIRGVAHLKVPDGQVRTLVRRVLGLTGVALAFLIALPFAAYDFLYLFSPDYDRLGGPGMVVAVDYLMWVIWSVEWFLNAFIWVVLIGFLAKNCWVIRQHPFRSPIEIVLHDRHYRPFLEMSSQGATIVLAFTLVTVAYIAYTGGEATDYAGLAITAILLVVGFVPPWVLLKGKVRRAIEDETLVMRQRLIRNLEQAELETTAAAVHGTSGGGREVRSLEHRLDAAVAILRISYLESRNQNLGNTEVRAILVRMAAPAVSIGWQLSKSHGDMVKDLPAYIGRLFG